MKRKITILLIGVVFLISIANIGCSDYKKVTLTKAGITFSFEYPASYKDPNHSLEDTNKENYLSLLYSNNSTKNEHFRYFTISFLTEEDLKNLPFSNAKEGQEYLLNGISNRPELGCELLECSTVQIDNIQGELTVFKSIVKTESQSFSYTSIAREVFIDYKNMVLWLEIFGHVNIADQSKNEFEHILKSFIFLD